MNKMHSKLLLILVITLATLVAESVGQYNEPVSMSVSHGVQVTGAPVCFLILSLFVAIFHRVNIWNMEC